MTTFQTSRHFSVPPDAVFAAIKSAQRLARWWGSDGFSNRFEVFEFTAGGKWIFDMQGPDGKVYPNESVFLQIEPNKLVTLQHVCEPHFQLSISLAPSPTGTLLKWEQTFDNAEVAQAVRHIVEPANEQNLNRLEAELAGAQ